MNAFEGPTLQQGLVANAYSVRATSRNHPVDWFQYIGETSQMLVRMLQGGALLGEASGHGVHLLVMKPGEWGSASAQASSSSSAWSAPIKTRYQINVLYCRGFTGVSFLRT